jgi:Protein of unknown function with HXXEE motif
MTFAAINLLFPLVLAIHNLDEYFHHDDFIHAYYSRLSPKLTSRRVVRHALVLLTLSIVLLDGLTYVYKDGLLVTVSKISIFALMFNGIGHCVLSLRRRTMLPGTLSAVTLVIPYAVFATVIMRTKLGDAYRSLLQLAVWGAITVPLATMLFLWIGYGIHRLETRNQ